MLKHSLLKHKTQHFLLLCVKSLLLSTLIVSTIFSIPLPKTWAASTSWIGGTDTNWNTASNWSTGIVPTSTDDVLIDANTTVNLTTSVTIRSLTLGNITGTTTAILNFNYDAITEGALVIDGGDLQTYTGSQITHTVATLGTIVGRMKITVLSGNANIQGTVNVTNKGYVGGTTNGANGYGAGGGIGWYSQYGTGGAGGAGHASPGQSANSAGGVIYQSLRIPTDLGSGGGRGYSYSYGTGTAGTGGGNVYITVSGDLTISGTISADGQLGGKYSGGGSGGSIYLSGDNVSISSTISSSGGAGGTSAGAGSCGRIVIEHSGSYTNTGSIAISTGSGLGTAYIRSTTSNDITIPVNNAIWYSSHLDSWNFRNFNVGADVTLKPSSTSLFTINLSGNLTLDEGVTLSSSGYYTTDTDGVGIYYNISGNLSIPSTSAITGDALGYAGGYSTSVYNGKGDGKGLGVSNHNYGNVTGSGGGHGGKGGNGGAGAGGSTYDDIGKPMKLGSGGGFGNSYNNPDGTGGSGGSAIKLHIGGTATIEGSLSADGKDATAIGGAGAGGSIYLIANTLSGAGTISATGGAGVVTGYGTGGAGGGGRIALSFNSSNWTGSSFEASIATARGSVGNTAGDGTVYMTPIFSDITATNVTSSEATLVGTVSNIEAGATDMGFEYSINADFSSPIQVSKGSGSSMVEISTDLSGLTESTTYYYKVYAVVQGSTAYSSLQSFTTLQSNTAPEANATNISGASDLYAGKTLNVVTTYSDADGASDLEDLYLYLKNPDGTDIVYYATSTGETKTSQTPNVVSGEDYVKEISYNLTVESPTSEDITVTWHITPDWDWALSDDIQYGIKAIDSKSAASTESYLEDTYKYESRLTLLGTLTVTDKNTAAISSESWTYANSNLLFSGLKVVYNNTSDIYPYDTDFDVKISDNLSNSWIDTISSGDNASIVTLTPDSTNTNIVYTLSIINIPTGGSDVSGEITFTAKTDKTSPSLGTLNNSIYTTSSNWYSSSSNAFTWSGSDTESGLKDYWYLVDTDANTTANTILTKGTKVVISSTTINNITNGISYFHLIARDNTENISDVTTYTLKRDSNRPDIVNVNGLYNGVWQNRNSGPVISWTNPQSPSNDTFYITNDNSEPSSSNYTYMTSSSSYDLPDQGEKETIINVRAQNGAGTYSTSRSFIIRYDKSAPANVSLLSAQAQGGNIVLSWQNSTAWDFGKVIIIRNTSHYPSNLNDGTKIYDGIGTTYTDTGNITNQIYYYTVFALDNVGNQSSGTMVSASISSDAAVVAPLITENTKVLTVSQLDESQSVTISNSNDKVVTTKENSDVLNVYSSEVVNIEVPAETITQSASSIEKVVLIINKQMFQMAYDAIKNTYKATINAPSIKGLYDTTIQTVSADNTSELAIKLSLKVDPHGYVYHKIGENELHISKATVSLYQLVGGTEVLWIPDDGTPNPQYTDETGEYSFFVEPGVYRIVVEADGYIKEETEWFTVETNIIEKNIQLKKNFVLPIIAGIGGIIAVLSSVIIIKKKRK